VVTIVVVANYLTNKQQRDWFGKKRPALAHNVYKLGELVNYESLWLENIALQWLESRSGHSIGIAGLGLMR
jgi:hypothetical protein